MRPHDLWLEIVQPGFIIRLVFLYVAIFVLGGIQLPFFPLWLKAKGLDEGMIGLVLALPMFVRVVAIPVASRAADRGQAHARVLAIAACATVAGYLLTGFAEGAWWIAAAYTLASLAYTPMMPLTESYALRGLAARGRAFGPVRLWGSLAFIAGTFLAGAAADLIEARHLIWLIVACSVLIAVAALGIEPLPAAQPAAGGEGALRRHQLTDPLFLAVVAAASLIQASHALYYGFSSLAWSAAGFDGTMIAALWALGVIAEIVLFALSGRLPVFLTPLVMIGTGAAGAAVRWLAMAAGPPDAALPLLQLLHALSFGATYLGALTFVSRHAPPGRAATAQGYLAIAMGLTMAAATGLSGWLFGLFGEAAYAAMALAAAAGGACALAAHHLSAKAAV